MDGAAGDRRGPARRCAADCVPLPVRGRYDRCRTPQLAPPGRYRGSPSPRAHSRSSVRCSWLARVPRRSRCLRVRAHPLRCHRRLAREPFKQCSRRGLSAASYSSFVRMWRERRSSWKPRWTYSRTRTTQRSPEVRLACPTDRKISASSSRRLPPSRCKQRCRCAQQRPCRRAEP